MSGNRESSSEFDSEPPPTKSFGLFERFSKRKVRLTALSATSVTLFFGLVLLISNTLNLDNSQPASVIEVAQTNSGTNDLTKGSPQDHAVGPNCVSGERVCEFVKDALLNWKSKASCPVRCHWTRYEEFVQHVMAEQNVTRDFATSIVDAVEYEWEEGSTEGSERSEVLRSDLTDSRDQLDQSDNTGAVGSASSSNSDSSIDSIQDSNSESILGDAESTGLCRESKPEDLVWLASYHVDDFHFSRVELIEIVQVYCEVSLAEAQTVVDSLNVDWVQEANQSAQAMAMQGPFSAERLRGALRYLGFTDGEAEAGVDNLNIDWYQQAGRKALAILLVQEPPCLFPPKSLIDMLIQDFMFELDEAIYGVSLYDDAENDLWRVCGPE